MAYIYFTYVHHLHIKTYVILKHACLLWCLSTRGLCPWLQKFDDKCQELGSLLNASITAEDVIVFVVIDDSNKHCVSKTTVSGKNLRPFLINVKHFIRVCFIWEKKFNKKILIFYKKWNTSMQFIQLRCRTSLTWTENCRLCLAQKQQQYSTTSKCCLPSGDTSAAVNGISSDGSWRALSW